MTPNDLLQKTAHYLPRFSQGDLELIPHGGSSRKFYRLTAPDQGPLIVVHYTSEREENAHYAECALFLQDHRIHVPEVMEHRPEEGLLWLQDLGKVDLWSYRHELWVQRRSLYEKTLCQAALLHCIPADAAVQEGLVLQHEFDIALYRWEQSYFLEHGLGGLCGVEEEVREHFFNSEEFQQLAASLASLPRQLIHRDFQSQNIMIHEGDAWLIDFQGLRLGLGLYDVASLLLDPYVELSPTEIDQLFHFYQTTMKASGSTFDFNIEEVFWQCGAQRLMQALGAYGFLSLHCGKPHFRNHVLPALFKLRFVLTKLYKSELLKKLDTIIHTVAKEFVP